MSVSNLESGAAEAKLHPSSQNGLTSEEVQARVKKFGSNTVKDTSINPLKTAIGKLWAPVPWMLEASIILELVLGKYLEGGIIGLLLVFNATLGYIQEGKAQATVAALKTRLALSASVKRNGNWSIIEASELVPDDIVKLSLGAVVPADVRLLDGEVMLDQSMLTGESVPIEAVAGAETFAGALVRRGEAVAVVIATGEHTKFGRTAELIRTAKVVSSQQKAVLSVVLNLAKFNSVVIICMMIYAAYIHLPVDSIISLVLTAVLAAIPVALPATFTLAAAVGARALAKQGVLPTRLSAVDEAASIDVLCADKTGTLTQNELKVTTVKVLPGYDEATVLALASLASSEAGHDPVDAAIRTAAAAHLPAKIDRLQKFTPFDPATKMSEALVETENGDVQRIVKGAFIAVSKLTPPSSEITTTAIDLEKQGYRVLAVATGTTDKMEFAGFIALSDPPRPDSADLITELKSLGVCTVMITGDSPITAGIVAKAVGLVGEVSPPGHITDDIHPEQYAVFAGVLPEDKYNLVKAYQKNGHVVGMCGDGANDAPALRQAQMGIAVSSATDVAKSAAGMVLTEPGLGGIVSAVREGRITFQRILTYTLNSVTKKIMQVLFIAIGLIMTGHAILSPMLIVIVMITGDFLTMSLSTDNVKTSENPNVWRIGNLTTGGILVGLCNLVYCLVIVAIGKFRMDLKISELQTLAAVALVFGSQATLYAVRERKHFWHIPPSKWVNFSSICNVIIMWTMATFGILMTKLPNTMIAELFGASIVFWAVINTVKLKVFRNLNLS